MLTNLSTEQLVGQAGQSFATNMGPIAREATSGLARLCWSWFSAALFNWELPQSRMEKRFDATVKRTSRFFSRLSADISAHRLFGRPVLIIFGIDKALGVTQLQGVAVTATLLASPELFTLFWRFKAVAVSDTVNGVGLLIGGILLPVTTLYLIGKGSIGYGLSQLIHLLPAKINAVNRQMPSHPDSLAVAFHRHGDQ